jgi:hypothetical protein
MLDLGDLQSCRVFVRSCKAEVLNNSFSLLDECAIYCQGTRCIRFG